MLDSSQQWYLFGYDVRRIGQHWQVAWAEFLWGDRSPIRARLDERVRVMRGDASAVYHAGKPVAGEDASCEAILLPDELVLHRSLMLPAAAEDELDAAMALEVMANSPFPAPDTAAGWQVVSRDAGQIRVELALVSLGAVLRHLGEVHDIQDPAAREVWTEGADRPIVLRGFGESRRLRRYKARLLRMAGWLAGSLALVIAMLLTAAGSAYLQMQQYQSLAVAVQRDAREATALRDRLAAANQTVATVNETIRRFPGAHQELTRLSALLGDEAWIAQYTQRGDQLRLRGRAADAASVIQDLTSQADYAEVTAPQGITRIGNTGEEQFHVDIRLRGDRS